MNPSEFLNLKTIPARLNSEQAACLIGCQPHNIPVLDDTKIKAEQGLRVFNSL